MGVHDRAEAEHSAVRAPMLRFLLVFTLANAIVAVAVLCVAFYQRDGILMHPNAPFGGDFVNLWTVGKLLLDDGISTIYDPDAFMAYQTAFTKAPIGLRLWAYPPHSLLFAWPAGLPGFFAGFVLWSGFGLAALVVGSRRYGFDWRETVILAGSPASLLCVYYGQTGNLFTGLMLIALAPRGRNGAASLAAALLTMKPQIGFLLPLLWIIQRRWVTIVVTGALFAALIVAALALFGQQPWRDYLTLTAPVLSALEREGTGSFLLMIPSLFISLRLLGLSGDAALMIHAGFAAVVFLLLARSLAGRIGPQRQAALVLVATCLIGPYVHIYDLTLLVAAALILLRIGSAVPDASHRLVGGACLVMWLAPCLTFVSSALGAPVTPIVILFCFLVVSGARSRPGQG